MYTRFQDILREALAPSVDISQARMMVTYSMRMIGATLTQILELEPSKEYAVGGWTATGASREVIDANTQHIVSHAHNTPNLSDMPQPLD